MKILVTGGAGFIGSHVVDAFVEAGHQVAVLDDLSTGKETNLNSGVEFFDGDIRSEEVYAWVKQAQFEVIDHHAAHIHVGRSVENPIHDADINIMGSLNLLKAAYESGSVKQIIFASTGGAMYGHKTAPFDESMKPQPLSPYGISKRAVELYLYFYQQQHGLNYTALRYANVYGPRQNPEGEAGVISIFLEALKSGNQPVINGDGLQTRDYVYCKDIARANLLALERRVNGEFNIGTARETNVNQIYSLVREGWGTEVQAIHGPPRPGEQITSALSYKLAQEVLGWEPTVGLEQGIQATVAYFRQ